MTFCTECVQKAMCDYYGICLEGRARQPEHEKREDAPDSWVDRDRESESPSPQRRKKRRKR